MKQGAAYGGGRLDQQSTDDNMIHFLEKVYSSPFSFP